MSTTYLFLIVLSVFAIQSLANYDDNFGQELHKIKSPSHAPASAPKHKWTPLDSQVSEFNDDDENELDVDDQLALNPVTKQKPTHPPKQAHAPLQKPSHSPKHASAPKQKPSHAPKHAPTPKQKPSHPPKHALAPKQKPSHPPNHAPAPKQKPSHAPAPAPKHQKKSPPPHHRVDDDWEIVEKEEINHKHKHKHHEPSKAPEVAPTPSRFDVFGMF